MEFRNNNELNTAASGLPQEDRLVSKTYDMTHNIRSPVHEVTGDSGNSSGQETCVSLQNL